MAIVTKNDRSVVSSNVGEKGETPSTPSINSGGSGMTSHSWAPLSSRSNASVVSMHANSYSYLSDRVYDFVEAKSSWMERMQSELEGQESEALALQVAY